MDEVVQTAKDALNKVGNVISDLVRSVRDALNRVIDTVVNAISTFISSIVDSIISVFNAVGDAIRNAFDAVVSSIQSFVADAITNVRQLVADVIDFVSGLVASASALLADLFDEVTSRISFLVNETVSLFLDIFSSVKSQIQTIVDSVLLFFEDLFNIVKDGINEIILVGTEVISSVTQAIDDFITSVVDVVGSSLRDLLETISNLPGAIEELAQLLLQSAKENIAEPLADLPLNLIKTLSEVAAGEPLSQSDKMQLDMLDMVFGQSPVIQTPEVMREAINKFMPENPILKFIIVALVSPLILLQTIGGVAQANSQIILQEHALVNPYRIMQPSDVVSAVHFKLIERDFAVDQLRKAGYTESVSETMIKLGDFTAPAGELVSWKLRGLIDDNKFKTELTKQGWRDDDINVLSEAAFFIPPVQDLITMAVREVFTPEIAESFGQFEDFPEAFAVQALKQGVSEDWAKRYWGAHWRLPSAQMGFEMLHRQVINESDLDLLLKASDIMPFWRDKIVEISFSPLTRVDIRRMHKVGVLSVEEVNKAYHDIGYNDLNAERLTDFTVKLNKGDDDDDDVALGDLTRSNVLRFFRQGIFDRLTSKTILLTTGVSDDAAELFLTSEELQIQANFREESIDLIIERAKSGTITFTQAEDDLNALDLQELEKVSAINKLITEQSKRNRLPSRSDLDKMWRKKIIGDNEYLLNIELSGYSPLWAERFLALNKGATSAN